MKKILIAVSLVISMLIVSQAMAFNPGRINGGWNTNLKLTAAQSARMATLRQKFQRDTLELRKKIMAERLEFHTLFSQVNIDENKVRASHETLLSHQKTFREKRFDHRLAMRKILTPEQLAMLPNRRCFKGGGGMGLGSGKGHGRHHGRGMKSESFRRPGHN
jgi:Spy/CpxP family protein refolding chaperone